MNIGQMTVKPLTGENNWGLEDPFHNLRFVPEPAKTVLSHSDSPES